MVLDREVTRWPLLVFTLWMVLVMTVHAWRDVLNLPGSVCWFKLATNVPCPTCGGIRVVVALAQGDVPAALRHNPFVFVAFGSAVIWALALRRWPTGREVRTAWPIALGLLVLGWAWLIVDGR